MNPTELDTRLDEILHDHFDLTCETECGLTHFDEDLTRAKEALKTLIQEEVNKATKVPIRKAEVAEVSDDL